jgi:hypothetical protein
MQPPYPAVRLPCSSSAATRGAGMLGMGSGVSARRGPGEAAPARLVMSPKDAMNASPWTASQMLITYGV